jgi:hypothetical protein
MRMPKGVKMGIYEAFDGYYGLPHVDAVCLPVIMVEIQDLSIIRNIKREPKSAGHRLYRR